MATRRDRVLASVETSDDDDRCRCPAAGRPVDRGRGACPNRGGARCAWSTHDRCRRVDCSSTSDGIGQLIAIPVTAGGRGSRPGRGGGSESKSAYRAPRSRAYGDGISCRLGRDRSQLDRCAGSGRARRRIMACSNGIRVRRFCARRGRIRRRRAGSRPDSESAPS